MSGAALLDGYGVTYQRRWLVFMHLYGPPDGALPYMVWVSRMWRDWERLNGCEIGRYKSDADHKSFDLMLEGLIG